MSAAERGVADPDMEQNLETLGHSATGIFRRIRS